jgi:hypothetical protein
MNLEFGFQPQHDLPTDQQQLEALTKRLLNLLSNMVDDYDCQGFVDHRDVASARQVLKECGVDTE